MILVVFLLACHSGEAPPLADATPVWVDARRVDEGQPVTLHTPAATKLPEVAGLTATQAAVGDDGTVTWELRGAKGSYVLEVPNGTEQPTRLFVDIGVDGPTGGEMADILAVPPEPPAIWPRVALAAAVVTGAAVGAFLLWKRFRPVPPPPPPEPADRIARREWAALRAKTDVEPAVMAAALSGVYRRYLEAVHEWPATSRTSREILDALAGDLPAVQLERARRLLFAMDIVRFSDRSTHEGFFAALDADFDALLNAAPRMPRA